MGDHGGDGGAAGAAPAPSTAPARGASRAVLLEQRKKDVHDKALVAAFDLSESRRPANEAAGREGTSDASVEGRRANSESVSSGSNFAFAAALPRQSARSSEPDVLPELHNATFEQWLANVQTPKYTITRLDGSVWAQDDVLPSVVFCGGMDGVSTGSIVRRDGKYVVKTALVIECGPEVCQTHQPCASRRDTRRERDTTRDEHHSPTMPFAHTTPARGMGRAIAREAVFESRVVVVVSSSVVRSGHKGISRNAATSRKRSGPYRTATRDIPEKSESGDLKTCLVAFSRCDAAADRPGGCEHFTCLAHSCMTPGRATNQQGMTERPVDGSWRVLLKCT